MKKIKYFFPLLLLVLVSCNSFKSEENVDYSHLKRISVEKTFLFGLDLDKYEVMFDTVQKGWTWSHIFSDFDISQYTINTTVEKLKDSLIDVKYIKAGKPFFKFIERKDSLNAPVYLVYEPDPFSYVSFEFSGDSVNVKREKRPVKIEEKIITGVIEQNSNLSVEINKHFDSYGMTAELASSIEGVYAWSIDFFRLQVGDKFVIVYDEKSVNGKPYAVDKIKYAWFEHSGEGLYTFDYTDATGEISGHYNERGEEMKRPFLKAPVQYTRISSTYNLNRFHPVRKMTTPHLGTDYAAPTGTPIYSTADGTVTAASQTRGNGLYVKVRHNKTYETQYLHMSRIAKGMKPGVRVKQGEVIGYVGQTGLATGPHVCYRFWKNGKQIDPRSEKFPNSEPMKESAKPDYLKYIAPFKEKLDNEILKLTSPPEALALN